MILETDLAFIYKKDLDELKKFDDENIIKYSGNPFTFSEGMVLDDNNKPLGYGALRVINEFKMVLDPNLSNYQKSKVIKLLMDEAIRRSRCDEVLITTTKDIFKFTNMIMKHYKFEFSPGFHLRLWK